MSAINALVQSDSVHMITDGLVYEDGLPTEVKFKKTVLLGGMRAAITMTGPAMLARYIAQYIEGEYRNFDQLVAEGGEHIKWLFKRYADEHCGGDAVATFIMIGWHESENRPAAYGLDLTTGGLEDERIRRNNSHVPPGSYATSLAEYPLISIACPTIEELRAAGYTLSADRDAIDPESNLLHLLEIQRRRKNDEGNHVVGGLAMLTSIDAHSVTQRIVHRWPEDEPGKKVVPVETSLHKIDAASA